MLRAHNETPRLFDEVAYWAPAEARQTEVDFLLRRGRDRLAIEVKSATRLGPDDLSGLRAIGDLDRLGRRILVYRGEQRLRSPEGIDVEPLGSFLTSVADGTLWP